MLQRTLLWATLGTLCSALGMAWDSAEFWCFIALFWAANHLGQQDGYRSAVVDMLDMLRTHRDALEALQKKLKEIVND